MKKLVALFALTVVVAMSATPAFASTGRDFGAHHSAHAIEMAGFTGDHNPGVHHTGYAGWTHE